MVALKNAPSALVISLMKFPISQDYKPLFEFSPNAAVHRATIMEVTTETRYYVASFIYTAQAFAARIRGYWGAENKVHYVREVTSGRGCFPYSHPTTGANFGNRPQLGPQFVPR